MDLVGKGGKEEERTRRGRIVNGCAESRNERDSKGQNPRIKQKERKMDTR